MPLGGCRPGLRCASKSSGLMSARPVGRGRPARQALLPAAASLRCSLPRPAGPCAAAPGSTGHRTISSHVSSAAWASGSRLPIKRAADVRLRARRRARPGPRVVSRSSHSRCQHRAVLALPFEVAARDEAREVEVNRARPGTARPAATARCARCRRAPSTVHSDQRLDALSIARSCRT